jgi:hypothetical protein
MDFLKTATNLDVAPLRSALAAAPHLFGQHPQRTEDPLSPHHKVSDIWLRFNRIENLGPDFIAEHDSVWYPAYEKLPEVDHILFPLMAIVHGERLGGVLITKLPPGGQVAVHTDSGWHADYYEKFYIPIQNGPGSIFRFPSGDIHADPGDCYWFNNAVPHSVINGSDTDRIAMIACIKSDPYRKLRNV